mmetsp:Transcript_35506/g.106019  ORF Transcript_35506/g.106019 Transcript_35506/m.106019 type:complete len:119 (-) Transcript_35506:454-810(-)|eukprot:CAMPEP_0113562422 /NCGR_PEP_ID=MMETSP0015_2-20120614/20517_1 /TAXON_ID=2838 /ORGANISM="Odontella" /LENGTH=118 /DNA_ID=CAMNT_0000464315 /DNA_START=200 /DNA_END=556 /DNA_ORIENTATION=+ /assembly_acc=CAM_ASM_000160
MSEQQADGFYPRVNAKMVKSGQFSGMIVSVVGILQSCDGSFATIQCADGDTARLSVEPDISLPIGKPIEVIGAANEDGSVQHFINRDLGDDFDLGVYNQMIEIQQNPKFQAEYFQAVM